MKYKLIKKKPRNIDREFVEKRLLKTHKDYNSELERSGRMVDMGFPLLLEMEIHATARRRLANTSKEYIKALCDLLTVDGYLIHREGEEEQDEV